MKTILSQVEIPQRSDPETFWINNPVNCLVLCISVGVMIWGTFYYLVFG